MAAIEIGEDGGGSKAGGGQRRQQRIAGRREEERGRDGVAVVRAGKREQGRGVGQRLLDDFMVEDLKISRLLFSKYE